MRTRSNSRSQVLIFVFFLIFILGALAAALLQIWESQVGVIALQQDGAKAFYTAQAAVSFAKGQLRTNWDWAGMDADSNDTAEDSEKAVFSGNKYWIDIISRNDTDPDNRYCVINAHGWSGNSHKVIKAELLRHRDSVGPPPVYTYSPVTWSWAEI